MGLPAHSSLSPHPKRCLGWIIIIFVISSRCWLPTTIGRSHDLTVFWPLGKISSQGSSYFSILPAIQKQEAESPQANWRKIEKISLPIVKDTKNWVPILNLNMPHYLEHAWEFSHRKIERRINVPLSCLIFCWVTFPELFWMYEVMVQAG